jgi:simple sugar transport system permease protein
MLEEILIPLLLAVLGGAIRVGTPFLFVSLGECLTEKSGRINLGLEGVLVFSAMSAFGVAYLADSAWLGVLAASVSGALLALLHGLLSSLKRVNDVAMGIAIMMLGIGWLFTWVNHLYSHRPLQLEPFPLANGATTRPCVLL